MLDDCALKLGSDPIVHAEPVVYNVEHDPSEMYALDSTSSEYTVVLLDSNDDFDSCILVWVPRNLSHQMHIEIGPMILSSAPLKNRFKHFFVLEGFRIRFIPTRTKLPT